MRICENAQGVKGTCHTKSKISKKEASDIVKRMRKEMSEVNQNIPLCI